MKEHDVQSAILDYLALRVRCPHQQHSRHLYRSVDSPQFRRLPKHTPQGIADILVGKDGVAHVTEVKSDNGGMRTEQHEFSVNVLAAGATYAVVRSIDDVAALGL